MTQGPCGSQSAAGQSARERACSSNPGKARRGDHRRLDAHGRPPRERERQNASRVSLLKAGRGLTQPMAWLLNTAVTQGVTSTPSNVGMRRVLSKLGGSGPRPRCCTTQDLTRKDLSESSVCKKKQPSPRRSTARRWPRLLRSAGPNRTDGRARWPLTVGGAQAPQEHAPMLSAVEAGVGSGLHGAVWRGRSAQMSSSGM